MTIQNKRIFASVLFVLISYACIAQGSGVPPPPGPPPPPGLPVDEYVPILFIMAFYYGIKNLLKFKEQL